MLQSSDGDVAPRRRRRTKFLLVAGLPLVAAVLAGAVLTGAPQQYKATTTITAPPAVATGAVDTPASVGQYAANYEAALGTDDVAQRVASETGAAVGDVKGGLHATQVSRSSDIQVTYVTTVRRLAGPVVVAAARDALADLVRPDVALQRQAIAAGHADVSQAQARYDHDRAAADVLTGQGVTTLVIDQYRTKLKQLSQLEVSMVTAQVNAIGAIRPSQSTYFDGRTSDLESIIHSREQELATLAPAAISSEGIQRDIASSLKDLSEARGRLQVADAKLTDLQTFPLVPPAAVSQISRTAMIVKGVVIVVVVALLISVGLLVVPSVVRLPGRIRDEQAVVDQRLALEAAENR